MSLKPFFFATVLAAGLLAGCAGGAPTPSQTPPAAARASGAPTSTLNAPADRRGVLPRNQLILGLGGDLNPQPPVAGGPMSQRPVPDANGLVRVALLAPLTGPSSPVGQALLNAAEMALFDVADERFVLQAYDTGGTPEGATEAAQRALSHGAQLILGPLFSAEAHAIAPTADAAGVNIVAFSTDPTIAGGRVFVLGFLVQEQVRQMIAYARAQGLTRFAVLAPESDYGRAVVEAFNRYVPAGGGQVTNVAYYNADGTNLNDVVRDLAAYDRRKQALEAQKAELAGKEDEISQLALERLSRLETVGEVDFDAVLLPDQGARLTQAATLLPFYDIDSGRVQLLGTMLWNTPGLGREPVMVGGVYPAPPQESNRQFFVRYRELFGRAAPGIASHGYDAVALAAVLARGDYPQPFSAEAITNPSGFAGVDGIFRFLPNGLSQRGFAIMQVTREGATEIEKAPATFEAPAS
ncbi:MAG: penicillin-binding protein activator [Proteobacteria bacterium]|nr:penicillin-binding protein activator [Pseudomonadota bacterium]